MDNDTWETRCGAVPGAWGRWTTPFKWEVTCKECIPFEVGRMLWHARELRLSKRPWGLTVEELIDIAALFDHASMTTLPGMVRLC